MTVLALANARKSFSIFTLLLVKVPLDLSDCVGIVLRHFRHILFPYLSVEESGRKITHI
jgi:hypothetical protein